MSNNFNILIDLSFFYIIKCLDFYVYRQRVILPAGMAETIEEFEINGLHSINTKTKNLE